MREVTILCDLDDGDKRRGVEVVRVVLGGHERTIDVCQEHLELLRSLPSADGATDHRGPATGVSRKRATSAKPAKAAPSSPARARKAPASRPSRSSRAAAAGGRKPGSRRDKQARIAEARAWARAQGRDVADKGRLPAGLLEEYAAAHR